MVSNDAVFNEQFEDGMTEQELAELEGRALKDRFQDTDYPEKVLNLIEYIKQLKQRKTKMFCTKEQQVVVNCKLSDGYTLIGKSKSNLNGLNVFVIVKGRHTMAINSLGYDEHITGKTWKLEEQ